MEGNSEHFFSVSSLVLYFHLLGEVAHLELVKTNASHFLTTNFGRQSAFLTLPYSDSTLHRHNKFSQEALFRCHFCPKPEACDGFYTQDHKADTPNFEHAAFWESTAAYRTPEKIYSIYQTRCTLVPEVFLDFSLLWIFLRVRELQESRKAVKTLDTTC